MLDENKINIQLNNKEPKNNIKKKPVLASSPRTQRLVKSSKNHHKIKAESKNPCALH